MGRGAKLAGRGRRRPRARAQVRRQAVETLSRTMAASLASTGRRRHSCRRRPRDLHGDPLVPEQPFVALGDHSRIASVNESSHDATLAMIEAQARQTEPLVDIIRPASTAGACPVVEPGHSAQLAIAAAARRILPTLTVRDVARTLDQYLGMCAIELRGQDAAGSVFVFDVVAPEGDTPSASEHRLPVSRPDETGRPLLPA